MFVRCQSNKIRQRYRNPDVSWSAILVESKRIHGQPRQQHLAYLGSITESGIDRHLPQRCRFWDAVDAAFERLGRKVSTEERKRLEAIIATKVPRPSAEEYRPTRPRRPRRRPKDNQLLSGTARPSEQRCSFCGKPASAVAFMIEGASAAICNGCIADAADMMAQRKAKAVVTKASSSDSC